jgi:ArsR family transcriptional regulator
VIEYFKSLGEENRLRILAILIHGDMCVCEIEESLKMTQSNVSRHLTALKSSGILESYKKAQWAYYKISDKFKEENQNLWIYIVEKSQAHPKYKTDYEKWQDCRQQDLCKSEN